MKNSIYLIFMLFIATLLNINYAYSQEATSKTIHQAAADGDIEQINLNLQNGKNVNEKDSAGNTPLHIAIKNKQVAAIDLLLEKRADVNIKDAEGATPLYLVVDNNLADVIEKLILRRADINAEIRPGENALTLARQKGYTNIEGILVRNGATMPAGNRRSRRLYPSEDGVGRENAAMDYENDYTRGRMNNQEEVLPEFLNDPNEIKARVKNFKGLDELLKKVDQNSLNETRQWQVIKTDNRIPLLNVMGKQYEGEIGLIKKIAVEEKAVKTTKAIDDMSSVRQERFKKISRELLMQRKEQRQAEQSTRTRGRGRTNQRNIRGRGTQETTPTYTPETTGANYSRRSIDSETGSRMGNTAEQEPQEDAQTQQEIDMWLDTTTDNKEELANSVRQQIMTEIVAVRTIAEEEKANKTIAAIDGLLLKRQQRFQEIAVKMEEERQKQERLEQIQQERESQQGGRTRGRGRAGQFNTMGGQQEQGRTRRR